MAVSMWLSMHDMDLKLLFFSTGSFANNSLCRICKRVSTGRSSKRKSALCCRCFLFLGGAPRWADTDETVALRVEARVEAAMVRAMTFGLPFLENRRISGTLFFKSALEARAINARRRAPHGMQARPGDPLEIVVRNFPLLSHEE